jgi:hypothetical protein
VVVLFTRWRTGEQDNVEPLHISVQHSMLEFNLNRNMSTIEEGPALPTMA